MSTLLAETKVYDKPPGNKDPGDFALSYRYSDGTWFGWISCREVMQLRLQLTDTDFWFVCGRGNHLAVVEFMDFVERALCIPSPGTTFQTSPKNTDLIFVTPDRFWMADEMRKNALTMFLRAAMVYVFQTGAKSVRKALESYEYSKSTGPALERFLLGFTKYTGPPLVKHGEHSSHITMGWNQQFGLRNTAYVRNLLVSP